MTEDTVQRLMGLADGYAACAIDYERQPSACAKPYRLRMEAARAALESALRELQPAGWMPIETAPKDGTTVLLYPPTWGNRGASTGQWDDDKFARRPRPYWRRDDSLHVTKARGVPPTHWMPLPAAPSATTAPAAPEVPADARMLEWLLAQHTTLDNGGLFTWFRTPPAFIAAGLDPRESVRAAIRAAMAAPTPQEQT